MGNLCGVSVLKIIVEHSFTNILYDSRDTINYLRPILTWSTTKPMFAKTSLFFNTSIAFKISCSNIRSTAARVLKMSCANTASVPSSCTFQTVPAPTYVFLLVWKEHLWWGAGPGIHDTPSDKACFFWSTISWSSLDPEPSPNGSEMYVLILVMQFAV